MEIIDNDENIESTIVVASQPSATPIARTNLDTMTSNSCYFNSCKKICKIIAKSNREITVVTALVKPVLCTATGLDNFLGTFVYHVTVIWGGQVLGKNIDQNWCWRGELSARIHFLCANKGGSLRFYFLYNHRALINEPKYS